MAEQERSMHLRSGESMAASSVEPDPQEQVQNPFLWFHQLMRGRYRWAVPLAIILATILGFAGYHFVAPVYQSSGLLQVEPVLPRVLYETEDKNVPMFDEYIQTQIRLLESADLNNMIANSSEWLASTGVSKEAAGDVLSAGTLTADRPDDTQMIEVSFAHPDPEIAQATVSAAIEAYMQLRRQRELQSDTKRTQVLREQETTLSNQIRSRRDQIHEIASEYGSDTLQEMYRFKVEEMQKFKMQLNEAESMLAAAKAVEDGEGSGSAGASSMSVTDMQLTELAQYDSQMRQYLNRRDQLNDQLKQLTSRFGDNHPQVREVRSELQIAEQRVQQHAEELRNGGLALGGAGSNAVSGAGMNPERLEARVEEVRQLYKQARDEAVELGRKNLKIQRLKDDITSLQARLDRTTTRLEELNIESTVGGRIRTLSAGGLPELPANTGTRLQATVLGAGAGGGLGIGLVALFGLLNPRFRDSVDAGTFQAPLLGVLPRLPKDLARSNAAALAADCVHHVRLMLQLSARGGKKARALTITSPDKGTGKTNLTLALGLSYASAGARTLLIDCDLAGHGLTHQTQAMVRRRLEEILHQEEWVDEDELERAMAIAASTGRPLGEVLLEIEAITPENLNRAFEHQPEPQRGVVDAIDGESLMDCVTPIGTEKLSVLPAGGNVEDVGRISPAAFERLLSRARKRFDVILIDTGPIPGGLDASMVAAQADAVLVLASRGDRRRSVEQCIDKLQAIGARIAGLVFNRADADDLAHSGYRSTYGQPSGGTTARRAEPVDMSHVSRFGLLAGAVATMTRRSTVGPDGHGGAKHNGNGEHGG